MLHRSCQIASTLRTKAPQSVKGRGQFAAILIWFRSNNDLFVAGWLTHTGQLVSTNLRYKNRRAEISFELLPRRCQILNTVQKRRC
mmetsp:Transcript_25131/g.64250  ORF Transcript_25131/g.64250 Transcript_25131/m.64250 type:complete len:86 (+) Transcript_25131:1286-1543(+)